MRKALDLFCCCGGVSKGLHNSNFEVTGVDITDDHEYPFDFVHSDVFKLPLDFFDRFDFIWASPPCQHYILTNKNKPNTYPDLIPATRELLLRIGKPFVIENVVGAPVRRDLMLCGEMFGLKVIRHRLFEINGFTVLQPPHLKHKNSVMNGTAIACYSGGINPGFWGNKERQQEFRKRRNLHSGLEDWQKAMNIDWITDKRHLSQAIPPAYSEYITRYSIR